MYAFVIYVMVHLKCQRKCSSAKVAAKSTCTAIVRASIRVIMKSSWQFYSLCMHRMYSAVAQAELKKLHEELAAVRSELRTALQTTVSTTNAIQTIETEVKELRTIVNSQAQNVLE